MVSKESQTENIKGQSDVNVSPEQSIIETEYEEEYTFDEDYKGPIYQSRPCFNKRDALVEACHKEEKTRQVHVI